MAPRPPAVDKLLAEKVLVSYIQAAEDLYLRPVMTTSTASEARSLLKAPHQSSDVMLIKLIVPPVRWRQSKAETKPVAAKIVQVTGQFFANVF